MTDKTKSTFESMVKLVEEATLDNNESILKLINQIKNSDEFKNVVKSIRYQEICVEKIDDVAKDWLDEAHQKDLQKEKEKTIKEFMNSPEMSQKYLSAMTGRR